MWSNPPAAVDSLKTMLQASATVIALSATNNIHYPSADILGENSAATADALPLLVIYQDAARRNKYAVGAAGLAAGTLRVELCMDSDVGTVEQTGQALLADLLAMDTGLAIQDGECSVASDPLPGERAANASSHVTSYRVITITLSYGLTV
jgi:hypothetical protein